MLSKLRERELASEGKTLFVVFLIALSIRLIFISTLEDGYYFADSWRFERAANHLVESGAFPADYERAPLYSVFLGANYYVLGNEILATRIVQAIMSALVAVFITFIGFRTCAYWVGVFAGILWSIYPMAIFVAGTIYPATLITTILAAGVMSLLLGVRRDGSIGFTVLAGLIFGLGALTKPIVMGTIAAITLWIFIIRETRGITLAAAFAIAAIIALVPWTVRNYEVHGRLVPIEARGLNAVVPWADNASAKSREVRKRTAAAAALLKAVEDPDNKEVEEAIAKVLARESANKDSIKTTASTDNSILAMAERMAVRYPKEFLSFFELYPRRVGFLNQNMRDRDREGKNPRLVEKIPFGTKMVMATNAFAVIFLYTFALLGIRAMWLSLRARRYLTLYMIMILSFAAGYATTWGKIRYRVPVDPYIILLSAWGLYSVWTSLALRDADSTLDAADPPAAPQGNAD